MMQKELFEALSQAFPGVKLVEAEPLKHRTSFRIGGSAPMAFPRSAAELAEMIEILKKDNVQATRLLSSGEYVSKRKRGDEPLSSQNYFMRDARRHQRKPKQKKRGFFASVGRRIFQKHTK